MYITCIYMWEKAHNNFEQTIIFKHMLFGHFTQESNYIWYLGEALTGLPGYQISLASCAKSRIASAGR